MIDPFHSGYLQTGTLANSDDPGEMSHNSDISPGTAVFAKIKKIVTIMHHNLEISTCDGDPLKYKMDNVMLYLFYQLLGKIHQYIFVEK